MECKSKNNSRPLDKPNISNKIRKIQKNKKFIWIANTKNNMRALHETNKTKKYTKYKKAKKIYGMQKTK